MKYKVGDKVRIKSLDWYNENKDEYGYIDCGSRAFFTKMSDWCGKIATIKEICKTNCYHLEEYDFDWTDEMIEGLVEEEVERLVDNLLSRYIDEYLLPDGYIFKDENGNVVYAKKIVLEKKEKEYPKTYKECCEIIHSDPNFYVDTHLYSDILETLYKLLICRDAYWKIAGEEMRLGKPWEPDWYDDDTVKYCIIVDCGIISKQNFRNYQFILAFPTPEMRDAFYENFKESIEECKELL